MVALGTVISLFGIRFILQYRDILLRFDVKDISHESLAYTVRALKKKTIGNQNWGYRKKSPSL